MIQPSHFFRRSKNCSKFCAALLVAGLCSSPVWAEGEEQADTPQLARQASGQPFSRTAALSTDAAYDRLREVVVSAQSSDGSIDTRSLEPALRSVTGSLGQYPNLIRVHGHEEPEWLSDRGDLTAQAVLALAAMEGVASNPARRDTLEKLAMGLVYLQRRDRGEYPFGAHVSWQDTDPMAELADGTSVPTTQYRTDRAYAVQALANAGQVLDEKKFLLSAQREALGMATHLLIHGKLVRSFSPQPKYSTTVNDALPLIEGFMALYKATGQEIYSDLAALATHWEEPQEKLSGPRWEVLKGQIMSSSSAPLLGAKSIGEPVTFQFIEAEDGKVVNKAIETLDFRASNGEPGRLAIMGRENTFWMRFDVPTEDDYLFDLSYLQSDIGGGLVSVMMRIDGDKIFQVPLGDEDGKSILRRRYVDGPRPLRSGPHSFGIRFSGLLGTKPALLDSVVVQPAVERRQFSLPDGQTLYLLRNVTDQSARTDVEGFASWPPLKQVVVTGDGEPSQLGSAEDRRRRKKFVTLPPHGVALLTVEGQKPEWE
jgi:hypothetical protein